MFIDSKTVYSSFVMMTSVVGSPTQLSSSSKNSWSPVLFATERRSWKCDKSSAMIARIKRSATFLPRHCLGPNPYLHIL